MTVIVANTANNNTFDYWRNRTNELAYAMSTYAVTTNSNTAVGNAAISGTMTANVFQVSNSSGTWVISSLTTTAANTSNVSTQVIDSYTMSDTRGAEYTVSVVDNTANNFGITKLLTFHDTGVAYVTEYASMISNSSIGAFSATANSTHVLLNFTPATSNTSIKFTRIFI